MSRDQLLAQGIIIEVLQDGACRVELPNGHRCIARVSREHEASVIRLAPSDRVHLEFHPYDLSRGRIILPG